MGVDAAIFARKAKKYFNFDRLSNIQLYQRVDPVLTPQIDNIYLALLDADPEIGGCDYIDVKLLTLACKLALKTMDPKHANKVGWLDDIFNFANEYKGDTFFVVKDNSAYWEYYFMEYKSKDFDPLNMQTWDVSAQLVLGDDFYAYTPWSGPFKSITDS